MGFFNYFRKESPSFTWLGSTCHTKVLHIKSLVKQAWILKNLF